MTRGKYPPREAEGRERGRWQEDSRKKEGKGGRQVEGGGGKVREGGGMERKEEEERTAAENQFHYYFNSTVGFITSSVNMNISGNL